MLLSRRALTLLPASLALATEAQADTAEKSAGPDLVSYRLLRRGIIALQSASVGFEPIAIVGDSRVESLVLERLDGHVVHNWGLGGATIFELAALLPGLRDCGYRPRAFVSLIGINNIEAKLRGKANSNWEILDHDFDVLASILGDWSQRVAMLTVPAYEKGFSQPMTTEDALVAAPLAVTLNAAIKSVCTRRGFVCVDLWKTLSDSDGTALSGSTLDGIHFAASGIAATTAAIDDALRQLFAANPE
jgi:hypothetical protein